MTKEEFAALVDGREYPFELTLEESEKAKAAGLVVVYGSSDDLMEFDGAFNDEVGANEGTVVRLDKKGLISSWDDMCHCGDLEEEEAEEYFRRKPNARQIEAIWDSGGYAFVCATDIPHATFEVVEEGDKYCRGIVFSLADL